MSWTVTQTIFNCDKIRSRVVVLTLSSTLSRSFQNNLILTANLFLFYSFSSVFIYLVQTQTLFLSLPFPLFIKNSLLLFLAFPAYFYLLLFFARLLITVSCFTIRTLFPHHCLLRRSERRGDWYYFCMREYFPFIAYIFVHTFVPIIIVFYQ